MGTMACLGQAAASVVTSIFRNRIERHQPQGPSTLFYGGLIRPLRLDKSQG